MTGASVATPNAPTAAEGPFERILLASEGRPFPEHVIARVVALAKQGDASVRVFSIARVHGVSFGFPNPGLLPTKREWAEQRDLVAKAVKQLRRKGIEADGHVVGTRKSTKRICEEATFSGCDAIVMAADPDRTRIIGDMIWSQEPQRVRRRAKRAKVPVFLVPADSGK
jgi:nucleotide-binding universal stress UspA family protein